MFTTSVRPLIPQEERVVKLSTIDQFMSRNRIGLVFCFRIDPKVTPESIARYLKQSLAATLTETPEFAGVIQPASNDQNGVHLYLGPSTGAILRCCFYTENHGPPRSWIDFEELAAAHFNPSQIDAGRFLIPLHKIGSSTGANCLIAQANFVKGGFILMVEMHHSMTDGVGYVQFMCSWARHMRSCSSHQPVELYRLPEAAFHRWKLSYGEESSRIQDFPGWKYTLFTPTSRPSKRNPKSGKLAISVWYVDRDRRDALRNRAISGLSETGHISRSVALSAFLWRHISMSRRCTRDPGTAEVKSSTLCIPVNLRTRMEPPLPDSYIGNATLGTLTRIQLDQLCSKEVDMLSTIALKVQASVVAMDASRARRQIGLINCQPTYTSVALDLDCWPGPDILITDISTSELGTLNWGCQLGPTSFLRPTNSTLDRGHCFIAPRGGNRGLYVFMHEECRVVEALRGNSAFTKYVNFISSGSGGIGSRQTGDALVPG